MRAYSGEGHQDIAKDNLTKEQKLALELAAKNTQLEEEKKKSLEQQKTIEHQRQIILQEQAKTEELEKNTAFLEARVKELYDALDKIAKIASLRRVA